MELGISEMILIGIVIALFFGPKKLPELGASIGKSIRVFKKTLSDTTSDLKEHVEMESRELTEGAQHAESEASQNAKASKEESLAPTVHEHRS
jgi:sec-independent protein translocase protein TatA